MYWHFLGSLDIFNLAWICGYSTPAFHAAANWRGRYHNHTLHLCFGHLSCTLYSQLAISILCREPLWAKFSCGRHNPNFAVFRFLLYILHQVSLANPYLYAHCWTKQDHERKEVLTSCLRVKTVNVGKGLCGLLRSGLQTAGNVDMGNFSAISWLCIFKCHQLYFCQTDRVDYWLVLLSSGCPVVYVYMDMKVISCLSECTISIMSEQRSQSTISKIFSMD